MPGDKPITQTGGANVRNLDAMVAAGLITQAKADKIRARAKEQKGKRPGKGIFGLFAKKGK